MGSVEWEWVDTMYSWKCSLPFLPDVESLENILPKSLLKDTHVRSHRYARSFLFRSNGGGNLGTGPEGCIAFQNHGESAS